MMRHRWSTLFAATLLAAPGVGQDAASTLSRLTERSTGIVQARVLQVRIEGEQRMALFKVQSTFKGQRTGLFELSEPRGHACGRALLGVVTGASYVLFLDSDTGTPRLTIASSRAVLPLGPQLLGHVRALARAGSSAAHTELLSHVLTSPHPRIRRDAAAALGIRRGLESSSTRLRTRVARALSISLDADTHVTAHLLRAALRLKLRSATPRLVHAYLTAKDPALTPVLRSTIAALDSTAAVRMLEQGLPARRDARTRAIELLAACPGLDAETCLAHLVRGVDRGVATEAQQALTSRRNGARPTFRAIRPHADQHERHIRTRTNR